VQILADALSTRQAKAVNGARILVLGAAYKKNVDDTRESPALHIMDLLQKMGAKVSYHDTYVPELPRTREYSHLAGMKSVSFDKDTLAKFDAVLIATDHENVDYDALVRWSKLVIDTRNATRKSKGSSENVVAA
jgi:UDP-N-acetyl-D-glucosamine dehydrogenase